MSDLRDLVIEESTDFLAKELKAKPGKLNAKIGMVRPTHAARLDALSLSHHPTPETLTPAVALRLAVSSTRFPFLRWSRRCCTRPPRKASCSPH